MLTNAAGSLRPEAGPGSLVALTDHINMQGFNPLMGPNEDDIGPRFPSLRRPTTPSCAPACTRSPTSSARRCTTASTSRSRGPSFETPAEIRAFKTMGADLVGMSTVPEAIVARHCGLRVAAVSVVTNLAEGMGDVALSPRADARRGQEGRGDGSAPLLRRWVGEQ